VAVTEVSLYEGGFIDKSAPIQRYKLLDSIIQKASNDQQQEGYPELADSLLDLTSEQVTTVITTKSSLKENVNRGSLRWYQTYGVHFILAARSALIMDSVGLGKTATVASVINHVDALKRKTKGKPLRYLFLTEVGLVDQARKELIRFTGDYVATTTGDSNHVSAFIKEQKELDFPSGVVASYSAISSSHEFMLWLAHTTKLYGKFDYFFIDEGSVLGSTKSDIYKACKTVRDKFVNHIVIMNATPFEKSIEGMYNQLNFLFPNVMPLKTTFEELFVKKSFQTHQILGYKDPELFKLSTRFMAFGTARKELGVSVKNSTCELIIYKPSQYQNQLFSKTRYKRYVWDEPSWFDPDLEITPEVLPKLQVIEDLFRYRIGRDKALIYVHSVEAQNILVKFLEGLNIKALTINGEDNTPKKKAAKLEEFHSGGFRVIVTNLKKGLNLGFINHLIFYSFTGNSGITNQIEGRIVRSQDIHDKHLYLLLARREEYKVLYEACTSTEDRLAHTKHEVSLLNNFFLNREVVDTVVEATKQEISEGASSAIAVVSYSNKNMDGDIYYPKWSDDLEQTKAGLTLNG
jgi:SWF/SNF family helicase